MTYHKTRSAAQKGLRSNVVALAGLYGERQFQTDPKFVPGESPVPVPVPWPAERPRKEQTGARREEWSGPRIRGAAWDGPP